MAGYWIKGIHFHVDGTLTPEEEEALSHYADWLNGGQKEESDVDGAQARTPVRGGVHAHDLRVGRRPGEGGHLEQP